MLHVYFHMLKRIYSHSFIQILKLMLRTVRTKKADEKYGDICLVFMFASWVIVPKFSQTVYLKSCLKNLILSKQFKYMHLKLSLCTFRK